jgi:Co/Zn/Cd efflux system component
LHANDRPLSCLNTASECCHSVHDAPATWRPVLWIALAINAGMFLTEVVAGLMAGSVSLQADALDFLGDAFNYGISLAVVGLALTWRARAALFKGITMCLFGLWVVGTTAWHIAYGAVPEPFVMGAIGTLALIANAAVALILYCFRNGDSNMRSVWVCSRNDVWKHRRAVRCPGCVRNRHHVARRHRGGCNGWPSFAG